MNSAIFSSDTGLSSILHQGINWTNADLLLDLGNMNPNTTIFNEENESENVVRKLAIILSRAQCVNNITRPGCCGESVTSFTSDSWRIIFESVKGCSELIVLIGNYA